MSFADNFQRAYVQARQQKMQREQHQDNLEKKDEWHKLQRDKFSTTQAIARNEAEATRLAQHSQIPDIDHIRLFSDGNVSPTETGTRVVPTETGALVVPTETGTSVVPTETGTSGAPGTPVVPTGTGAPVVPTGTGASTGADLQPSVKGPPSEGKDYGEEGFGVEDASRILESAGWGEGKTVKYRGREVPVTSELGRAVISERYLREQINRVEVTGRKAHSQQHWDVVTGLPRTETYYTNPALVNAVNSWKALTKKMPGMSERETVSDRTQAATQMVLQSQVARRENEKYQAQRKEKIADQLTIFRKKGELASKRGMTPKQKLTFTKGMIVFGNDLAEDGELGPTMKRLSMFQTYVQKLSGSDDPITYSGFEEKYLPTILGISASELKEGSKEGPEAHFPEYFGEEIGKELFKDFTPDRVKELLRIKEQAVEMIVYENKSIEEANAWAEEQINKTPWSPDAHSNLLQNGVQSNPRWEAKFPWLNETKERDNLSILENYLGDD